MAWAGAILIRNLMVGRPLSPLVWKVGRGELGTETLKLTRDTTNGVAVVAIVVVLRVHVAISIDVQVVCVVAILHYARPEVAVARNVVGITVPVAAQRKTLDRMLEEHLISSTPLEVYGRMVRSLVGLGMFFAFPFYGIKKQNELYLGSLFRPRGLPQIDYNMI